MGLVAGMQGSAFPLPALLTVGAIVGTLFCLGQAGAVSLSAAGLVPSEKLAALFFLWLGFRTLRSSPAPRLSPWSGRYGELLVLGLALGADSVLAGAGIPPGQRGLFLPFLVGLMQAVSLALSSRMGRGLGSLAPLAAVRYLAAAAYFFLAAARFWKWV